MKQALGYIRFSTDDQKDGNSIDRQTVNIETYCKRNDLDLVKTLKDEGLSAFKGEHISRGHLGKFLTEADSGKYQGFALVVEHMDRLSRLSMDDSYMLIRRILLAGVEVHFTQSNRISKDLNDIGTVLINSLETYGSNDYSARLRGRLESAWGKKKADATNGKAMTSLVPSWLRATKGGSIEIIPERVAILHKIFALAVQGLGSTRIANRLTADGDQPFGVSGTWTTSWIKRTLASRSVLGEYQPRKVQKGTKKRIPDGDVITNYYPPVISISEFEAAREAVTAKLGNGAYNKLNNFSGTPYRGGSRASDARNLFAGMVFDVKNNRNMHFKSGRSRSTAPLQKYLVTAYKAGEKSNRIKYDRFEKAFLGFLSELDWKAVAGQTDSTALIANRAQREQVKADLDRVNRLITKRSEQMKNPDLADETVKLYAEQIVEARTRSTELSTEQDRLQKLIDHEASKAEALYSPEALLELLKSGSATNDLRLRLSAEIRKRILRLDCVFGTRLVVYLRFVNGADKMIDFLNDEPILAHQRSWERGELK